MRELKRYKRKFLLVQAIHCYYYILNFISSLHRAILDSEEKATTPEVAGRLHELRLMKEHKDKGEFKDEFEQICNIEALIDAYESGKLEYNNGLVTYWSKGKQISQPRPFDWDESETISKHCGPKSFWVEGVSIQSHCVHPY